MTLKVSCVHHLQLSKNLTFMLLLHYQTPPLIANKKPSQIVWEG